MTQYFFSFLSLALVAMGGCHQEDRNEPPPSVKEQRTMVRHVPRFSGEKAFQHLQRQVAFGPRSPGTSGHSACLSYLLGELSQAADTAWQQRFNHRGYDNQVLSLTNIIASFNPRAEKRILLCAHWDTRPRADHDESPDRRDEPILGANDGASGVGVLLELARMMHADPPPVGVDIVLFDGEDYGHEGDLSNYLLGSRYFSAQKPPGYRPVYGILLDMVGDSQLEILREQNSVELAPDIVDLVWMKARSLGIHQFVDEIGPRVSDDHLPLNAAGIKTIDIIDFDYPDKTNRFWHTHQDTPDNCSPQSLEAVGTILSHLIYE